MNFSKLFKQFSALALVATFASANVFAMETAKTEPAASATSSTPVDTAATPATSAPDASATTPASTTTTTPATPGFVKRSWENVKWAINPLSTGESLAKKFKIDATSKKTTAVKAAVTAGYVAPVVGGIAYGAVKFLSSKFKKSVVKAVLANDTLTMEKVQDILPANDEVATLIAEFNAQKDEEFRKAIAEKLADIANQNQGFAQKFSAVFASKNEAAAAA